MLRFDDIHVGTPCIDEELVQHNLTPQECRLRDLTYAAPITVDIQYVRNKSRVIRKAVPIGRLPIMLRSSHCVLVQELFDFRLVVNLLMFRKIGSRNGKDA